MLADTVETILLIDGPCRDTILDVAARHSLPPTIAYVDGEPYVLVERAQFGRPVGVPWEYSHLRVKSMPVTSIRRPILF